MTNRRQFLSILFGALVTAPLIALGWKKAAQVAATPGYQFQLQQGGVSIRIIRQYDARDDRWIERHDILYGFSIRPELSCRIIG